MSLLSEQHPAAELADQLRDASGVTVEFMAKVISMACRRFPSLGQSEKTARIERLIHSGAWTDTALALLDLELPQWQLRRIAYDQGEWYCALSRQRELPDWLDQSIEGRHADLALAMLGALLEAERITAPTNRTSVPAVTRDATPLYLPLCSDNFA
jgi:hypothetical protein